MHVVARSIRAVVVVVVVGIVVRVVVVAADGQVFTAHSSPRLPGSSAQLRGWQLTSHTPGHRKKGESGKETTCKGN